MAWLAEKLRDYGVNEETITNVLKGIKSEVKEVVARNGGTEGKNTPDVSRAQDAEGIDNTFLGRSARSNNTTGSENTFAGQAAGYQNTTGNANNFLGYYAGYNNTTANGNIFIGTPIYFIGLL